jgi:hypothetical protein
MGIGIGCQRLQASQVPDIKVGPDHTISDSGPGTAESDIDGSDNSGSDTEGDD